MRAVSSLGWPAAPPLSLSLVSTFSSLVTFSSRSPPRSPIHVPIYVPTLWIGGGGGAGACIAITDSHAIALACYPFITTNQPPLSLSLQRPLSHSCVVRFPPKIPSKFKAQQASSLHLGSSDRRSEETDRVRLDRRLSRRSEGKGGVRRDGWLLPTATSSPSRGTRRGMRRQ